MFLYSLFWQLVLVVASFLVIWSGADFVVEGVVFLTKKTKIAEFWVSFFVLGLAVTAPEISVGINAVVDGKQQVFVANLLGSTIGLFLMIIPLLAIAGGGVRLLDKISNDKMIMALGLILLPFILMVGGQMTRTKAVLCLTYYLVIVIYFGFKAKEEKVGTRKNRRYQGMVWWLELLKFVIGVGLILFSGDVLVGSIDYIVEWLGSSLYVVSFFLLSLGTTAPELVLAIKSCMRGDKEVAFGGYLGSAVANSLLFGVLSLISGNFEVTGNGYFLTLSIVFGGGLILFYVFSKTKDVLSRIEGVCLLSLYLAVAGLTLFF